MDKQEGTIGFSKQERIALIIFFAIALIYAGISYLNKNTGVNLGSDILLSSQMVNVRVEGRVISPGMVTVPKDAVVRDAILAAGGYRDGADEGSVDEDESVRNNMIIFVGFDGGLDPDNPYGLLNINNATLEELDGLPGIGETLGRRIIEYRERHGGFTDVSQLLDVEGIGEEKYGDIRHLVRLEG